MIRNFKDADTAALFEGKNTRRFQGFDKVAIRKLRQLHLARDLLKDLGTLPGNRLKTLGGDRKDQWSIRINDQWRVCFRWQDGDAFDVEIVDYH